MRNSRFKALGFTVLSLILLSACDNADSDNSSAAPVAPELTALETAREIHRSTLVLDAHADIVIPSTSSSFLSDDGMSKVDPTKLQAGGVNAVVMSVAVGPGPRTAEADVAARAEADEKLAAIKALAEQHKDTVVITTTAAAVKSAHNSGKAALILGFQNARSLQQDITGIDTFYNEGVRVFGLNHLAHNDFSDSSRPLFNGETGEYEAIEEHGGLSALGVTAIQRINALGAVVDVSQMSKAATLQTLEMTTAPLIASHSNVRNISDVNRNLTDEEIDAIGANNGVIHVAAFKGYLLDISDPGFISTLKALRRDAGIAEDYDYPFELYWEIDDLEKRSAFTSAVSELLGPASVDNMIEHIDYIVNRIGVDHVGIGNDFNHGSGIDGYQDASDTLNVTIGLVERGYSAQDIEKIWSGNFLRVFEEAAMRRSVN